MAYRCGSTLDSSHSNPKVSLSQPTTSRSLATLIRRSLNLSFPSSLMGSWCQRLSMGQRAQKTWSSIPRPFLLTYPNSTVALTAPKSISISYSRQSRTLHMRRSTSRRSKVNSMLISTLSSSLISQASAVSSQSSLYRHLELHAESFAASM